MNDLLTVTPRGLYCEAGDFYIDPWKAVHKAVITHAHADHARWGSKKYLAAGSGKHVLRTRLGEKADLEFQPLGESLTVGGVKVTFVPAGHILGSAQVVLEKGGHVVVVSGDYKRETGTISMQGPHQFVPNSSNAPLCCQRFGRDRRDKRCGKLQRLNRQLRSSPPPCDRFVRSPHCHPSSG